MILFNNVLRLDFHRQRDHVQSLLFVEVCRFYPFFLSLVFVIEEFLRWKLRTMAYGLACRNLIRQ